MAPRNRQTGFRESKRKG
uniref:Uncharacterized protein n=1 Tax=Rhizophora mucronata TaxID=61149 RepID=A0A2P2JJC5_RHIMU